MATALSSSIFSLPAPRGVAIAPRTQQRISLSLRPAKVVSGGGGAGRRRMALFRPVASAPTPPGISEKVSESIKKAEETCAGDPVSGECVAAWDEVEELSAAASHARDKAKKDHGDPLEAYCKDNPETIECRTYED